jgi:putative tryptophan/tyrosine transport system substrate-binding protein
MKRRQFIAAMAAAALPAMARAQQAGRMPTVAYLWHAGNAQEEEPYYSALREGFARLGYREGRNLNLIHRFPNEVAERFRTMAEELVAMNVDVLMGGGIAAPYLKRATSKIPIVFMFAADPEGLKLVQSLAQPGGNATGLSNFGRDIAGKRLELLKELVPNLSRVGFLINSTLPATPMYVRVMEEAAAQLKLQLQMFEAQALAQMAPAFDAMVNAGMQAATMAQGGTSFQARHLNPKLALERRLPLLAYSRETFESGALASYGPSSIEAIHRSAVFVEKILKGASPAKLPVEFPTQFELLINARTAKALGLAVPDRLRLRATEVTGEV